MYYTLQYRYTPHTAASLSTFLHFILIVFIILAKCYKLYARDNEINVHLIAEEHYDRYIDQEVKYNSEMGYSLECTN